MPARFTYLKPYSIQPVLHANAKLWALTTGFYTATVGEQAADLRHPLSSKSLITDRRCGSGRSPHRSIGRSPQTS